MWAMHVHICTVGRVDLFPKVIIDFEDSAVPEVHLHLSVIRSGHCDHTFSAM